MANRYSRLERHNQKQSNKQAFFYILLSLVFIAVMFKWGLTGLIGLVTSRSEQSITSDESNKLRPQKPVLDPLPEATFSAVIKVSGVSQEKTEIRLRLNGLDKAEVKTDDQGVFEFEAVELRKGENQLEITALNRDLQSDAVTVVVIQDDEKPEIKINSPEEEHKFFGFDQRNLEITGEISEEGEITINGNFVHLDDDNRFAFQTAMSEGANDYAIKVIDLADNVTERLFRVFYSR